MEYFYALKMGKEMKNKFPSREELKKLFSENVDFAEVDSICKRIRESEPYDEFSYGIKHFLEQKNYNIHSLREWTNSAKQKIEKRLNSPGRKRKYHNFYKAAAIIIISLGLFSLVYQNNSPTSGWKKYYRTDPGLPVFMSAGNNLIWLQQYRAGNFSAALSEINNQLIRKGNNDTLLYYKMICLFETGQLDEEKSFMMPNKNYFAEKASMIMAFNLWREGDKEQAMLIFNNLSKSTNKNIRETASAIIDENTCK